MTPPESDASKSSGEPDSPEAIKEQIEETRAELAETVEALAYKADVKSRTKEKAAEVSRKAKETATGSGNAAREKVTALAQGAAGKAGQVADRAKQATPLGRSSESPGDTTVTTSTTDPGVTVVTTTTDGGGRATAARERVTALTQGATGRAGQIADRARQAAARWRTTEPSPTSNGAYGGATVAAGADRRKGAIATGGVTALLLLVALLIRRRRAS
jgi:hypothetical protein